MALRRNWWMRCENILTRVISEGFKDAQKISNSCRETASEDVLPLLLSILVHQAHRPQCFPPSFPTSYAVKLNLKFPLLCQIECITIGVFGPNNFRNYLRGTVHWGVPGELSMTCNITLKQQQMKANVTALPLRYVTITCYESRAELY